MILYVDLKSKTPWKNAKIGKLINGRISADFLEKDCASILVFVILQAKKNHNYKCYISRDDWPLGLGGVARPYYYKQIDDFLGNYSFLFERKKGKGVCWNGNTSYEIGVICEPTQVEIETTTLIDEVAHDGNSIILENNISNRKKGSLFNKFDEKQIIDNVPDIDKLFYSIDKNTLNKLLSVFLTSLKKNYRENPNVEDIDLWINKYDISQCSVRSLLDLFDKEMFNLTVGAEILIQIAIIYIHSGEIGRVKLARDYLFRAVKIYLNQTIHDEIAFKRIVYSRWLIAVTFKQERNFGYANELCEELIEYINDENEVFGIPFSDSLLLPQRELVVINKEEIMSDYLLFHMEDITINPKELFYTHRRLLELYILNNDFDKAKDVVPELLTSFSRCKNHIDKIYHVGLFQSLFEYYSYIGDKESADAYYQLAINDAKKNYMKGKEKKLKMLKQIYE